MIRSRILVAAPAAVAAFHLFTAAAVAQTAVGGPPPPPTAKSGPPAAAPAAPPPAEPAIPVPDDVVQQIKDHSQGNFGLMSRTRSIGQIQSAWDAAPEDAAVFTYDLDPAATYKIRAREYMVTVVELPQGEVIEAVDIGDGKGFEVKKRGDRRLAIRPSGFGFDTNIVVYGKSGTVYPIYIRAEGYNSKKVPDLLVRIDGAVRVGEGDPAVPGFEPLGAAPATPAPLLPPAAFSGKGKGGVVVGKGDDTEADTDFVKSVPFDPSKLHGWNNYSLWGDDSLRPETVFRDEHFTYVKFGSRWKDVELPTAYVVVDGIDELVNTRVDGDVFIIESTRPLITLKSGKSFLCIKYTGAAA